MLFYSFDNLDSYLNTNLVDNLKSESINLENILNLYKNKKEELLNLINNMVESTDCVEKNELNNFYDSVYLLRKSLKKINEIENLVITLKYDIIETAIFLYNKNFQNNKDEIKANLVEYNKKSENIFNKIINYESTTIYALNSPINLFLKNIKPKNKFTDMPHKSNVHIETNPHDYNTLLISEKEQKVYLPFLYKDIEELYSNSNGKYKSMENVIEDIYIMPLDRFKDSSISRFRESFNLIRNKEHGSILQALDLGLELMFKYELNPIIIAACRNLDELDIYLDCLDNKETDDFKCFEIKFEVMPHITK